MLDDPRRLLTALFTAAVEAASPALRIPPFLPPRPVRGRTVVVGAGKAAAAMARAVEDAWPGPLEGLVLTRYGHAVPCRHIEVVEGAHPVPDENGRAAAERILRLVSTLGPGDQVLALVSGGGSALLTLPAPGLTLADKRAVNTALLRSGAPIGAMNTVRKHLSAIKGGQLAAAAFPAAVHSLLISDVPGDEPGVIASGPTVADPTTFADALAVLDRYGITEPASALAHLRRGAAGTVPETPKPGDPRLARTRTELVATPQMSLEAAAGVAQRAGVTPMILGDALEGEAREVGRVMAGIARQVRTHGQPLRPPCVLLSGGETTVTVRGNGRGGRNVEFALALALALDGQPGTWALAGDTDGVDGAEEIAGAVVTPDTLARAAAAGLHAATSLDRNDGHGFFRALGDSIVTGPTLTNVNDFRAVLVL